MSDEFSSRELVSAYLAAIASEASRGELKRLCSPEISFHNPLHRIDGLSELLSFLRIVSPKCQGIKVRNILTDGQRVAAVYDFTSTDPEIGTFTCTDIYSIENGQIRSVFQNFDASLVREVSSQI